MGGSREPDQRRRPPSYWARPPSYWARPPSMFASRFVAYMALIGLLPRQAASEDGQ
jgi:hypothetical protein